MVTDFASMSICESQVRNTPYRPTTPHPPLRFSEMSAQPADELSDCPGSSVVLQAVEPIQPANQGNCLDRAVVLFPMFANLPLLRRVSSHPVCTQQKSPAVKLS